MKTDSRAGPDWIKEPGIPVRFPKQVVGYQVHGPPSSVAFPDALARSGIGNGTASI